MTRKTAKAAVEPKQRIAFRRWPRRPKPGLRGLPPGFAAGSGGGPAVAPGTAAPNTGRAAAAGGHHHRRHRLRPPYRHPAHGFERAVDLLHAAQRAVQRKSRPRPGPRGSNHAAPAHGAQRVPGGRSRRRRPVCPHGTGCPDRPAQRQPGYFVFGVQGVNNHMGSRRSASPEQMRQIFSILKKRDLFYIDTAPPPIRGRSWPVRCNCRLPSADIFLDHKEDAAFIRNQLNQLIKRAQAQGYAVAIGHPYRPPSRCSGVLAPASRPKSPWCRPPPWWNELPCWPPSQRRACRG